MATKNIAITEDAYNLLVRHKRLDESFSKVIIEHFGRKKTLLDYAGIWAHIPEGEWKLFERKVGEARKGLSASIRKRAGALK
ncbi:antitoxin VapB family protein [Candidatus Woesearchaeota archaeon]|nr:antitoxin VapB family protein [Candidatus Woesearchaeota archaeon]